MIGALHRRTAIIVTAIGSATFLILVIAGAVSSTHHAPGTTGN
jgi:hypothetical protein